MAKIRTFIAVLLSDKLKQTIASVQDEFKRQAPDFKWVDTENFHITLKFLGNVEEQSLDTIHAAIQQAASGFVPFELSVTGAGAFPNTHRPRVVWIGIGEGAEALATLAHRVESLLEDAGFPKEEKDFKAHITIGRARDNSRRIDLSEAITKSGSMSVGVEQVNRVVLMKSVLGPQGPIYTPLRKVQLTGKVEIA